MPNFFPPGPQGNITYETLDVTEPFPEHLQNTFDLTHLRYVLAGAGKCGIEKAIENLAGGWQISRKGSENWWIQAC